MDEKFATIGIGVALGGILAGGIIFGPKILEKAKSLSKPPLPATPVVPINQTSTPSANLSSVSLDVPDDNSSTTDNAITISGKTAPGQSVFIFGPADEKVATADAAGTFSVTKFKLEEGDNPISATIIDGNGNPVTVQKSVALEITQ